MSTKFVPSNKGAPSAVDTSEQESNVRMKKVTPGKYKTGVPQDKTVGGSSGPGYNFTGVIPGSE